MKSLRWLSPVFVLAAPAPALAADLCKTLTTDFDSAIHSKQGPAIENAFDAIESDVECGFAIDDYRAPAVAAEIQVLSDPAQGSAHAAALEFATKKLSVAGRWQLAEKLGDYFYKAGNQGDARKWYGEAQSFSRSHPVNPSSEEERSRLAKKAEGLLLLASNDDEGRKHVQVASATTAHAGVRAVLVDDRGVKPVPVSLPINFVFAKSDFTQVGQAAADDLADAIHEQGVKSLLLIGHTDPRGDKMFNLNLSRQRAERLRAYLLARLANAGDAPEIRTLGVGDQQPFDFSVLPVRPSQEEIYALDRRVEFLRGGD